MRRRFEDGTPLCLELEGGAGGQDGAPLKAGEGNEMTCPWASGRRGAC